MSSYQYSNEIFVARISQFITLEREIRLPYQSFGSELPVLEFFCIRSCTCFSFCSSNFNCCSASRGDILGLGCCFCSSFFFFSSCFLGGFFFFYSSNAF